MLKFCGARTGVGTRARVGPGSRGAGGRSAARGADRAPQCRFCLRARTIASYNDLDSLWACQTVLGGAHSLHQGFSR
eukprot:2923202-Prymnesium_polylepis.2